MAEFLQLFLACFNPLLKATDLVLLDLYIEALLLGKQLEFVDL